MDRPSTDKLVRDMHAVVNDAEDLLKATAGQTGEQIDQVRARAASSLRAARQRLDAAGRTVNRQMHDNPWTAVGVAAAVGAILGLLVGRRY